MKAQVLFILFLNTALANSFSSDNSECEKLKLRKLAFDDLIKVAQKNDYCTEQAIEVFQRYHEHKKFALCPRDGTKSGDKILIGCDLAETFLSTFGQYTKYLEIIVPEKEATMFGQLINLHCSKSLIELEWQAREQGAFIKMQKPFEKLSSFSYSPYFIEQEQVGTLQLNELFPGLHTLKFQKYSDRSTFNRHFPTLTNFEVYEYGVYEESSFFDKNPQINSFKLFSYTMELLASIQQSLEKIETIEIDWPSDVQTYQGEPLQFNGIKSLTLFYIDSAFRSGILLFKNLERVEVWVTNNVNNVEWSKFFEEHNSIQELELRDADDSKLLHLSNAIPKLEKATISSLTKYISCETAIKFVNSHTNLKTFQFRSHSDDFDTVLDGMRENLGKEWALRNQTAYTILFSKNVDKNDDENDDNDDNSGSSLAISIHLTIVAIIFAIFSHASTFD